MASPSNTEPSASTRAASRSTCRVTGRPSSSLDLAVEHDRLSSEQGVADATGEGAPGVGGVAGPRRQGGGVDGPGGGGVEDAEVGRAAGLEATPVVGLH